MMFEATVEACARARYPSFTPGAAETSPSANHPLSSLPATLRCSSTLMKPAASRACESERKEVLGAPLKHLLFVVVDEDEEREKVVFYFYF